MIGKRIMQTKGRKKKLQLLHHMIIHKIQLQFSDQLLGYAWAVINPLVYIASFWFFAYIGVRDGTVNDMPFIIWVIPGLLAYRFVSSVFASSAVMLTSNAMLIKETEVDVRTIPLIEALKECYVHIAVMFIMFILFAVVGYSVEGTWEYLPTIYYLNFIYYWFTAFVFVVVLAYIVSAIGVIFRDTKNIISAIMVPIFWTTPVLFAVENGVNPDLEKMEKIFNPFYYFIHGYKNSMLYGHFFYEDMLYNIYIWLLILIMILIARRIWKFILPIVADLI